MEPRLLTELEKEFWTTTDASENRSHVFDDLRPYVCTFENCTLANHLFEKRHEWFRHELDVHRREWYCKICCRVSATKGEFQNHLEVSHSDIVNTGNLEIVMRSSEKVLDQHSCVVCSGTYTTDRLRSHLAHHLQQLSLFVLPRSEREGQSEAGSNNSRGQTGSAAGDMGTGSDSFPGSRPDFERKSDVSSIPSQWSASASKLPPGPETEQTDLEPGTGENPPKPENEATPPERDVDVGRNILPFLHSGTVGPSAAVLSALQARDYEAALRIPMETISLCNRMGLSEDRWMEDHRLIISIGKYLKSRHADSMFWYIDALESYNEILSAALHGPRLEFCLAISEDIQEILETPNDTNPSFVQDVDRILEQTRQIIGTIPPNKRATIEDIVQRLRTQPQFTSAQTWSHWLGEYSDPPSP